MASKVATAQQDPYLASRRMAALALPYLAEFIEGQDYAFSRAQHLMKSAKTVYNVESAIDEFGTIA